ncbi:MAG: outer membrane protein transport protein [Deltaproteobacteria bacterium]|nr:outer membrane protein transport protein [Deltaproteobacteria bacterium]MBF0524190.1 outer membrane protein transport protein [Deltaproteobacteria bacterium]
MGQVERKLRSEDTPVRGCSASVGGLAGRGLEVLMLVLGLGYLVAVGNILPAEAQVNPSMHIASSPNPVGSGARALGMGGAFIAVADDATAASWNPGGLIQLERPEISIVGASWWQTEINSSQAHPESNGRNSFNNMDLNYLSAAYPFYFLERNMIVSLNFQDLYDMNKDIKYNYKQEGVIGGIPFSSRAAYTFEGRGSLRALSPAFAVEITNGLSLGLAVNVWTDKLFWSNGWTRKLAYTADVTFPGKLQRTATDLEEQYHDLFGINYHIGALWNVNKWFTLGAVVKTPFTMKLTRTFKSLDQILDPPGPAKTDKNDEDIELDFPLSYGLGTAFRLSDKLTLSADIYRTEWSQHLLRDSHGNVFSPIADLPQSLADVPATHQIRIGGEYLFILEKTIIPARAGIFYDPQPAQGTVNPFYGFSLGSGVMIGDTVFDVAYQYRWGREARNILFQIPDATTDVDQHMVLLSVIQHF